MVKQLQNMTPEELEELDRETEEMMMTEEEEKAFYDSLKNHPLPSNDGPKVTYGGTWSFDKEGNLILWP